MKFSKSNKTRPLTNRQSFENKNIKKWLLFEIKLAIDWNLFEIFLSRKIIFV